MKNVNYFEFNSFSLLEAFFRVAILVSSLTFFVAYSLHQSAFPVIAFPLPDSFSQLISGPSCCFSVKQTPAGFDVINSRLQAQLFYKIEALAALELATVST